MSTPATSRCLVMLSGGRVSESTARVMSNAVGAVLLGATGGNTWMDGRLLFCTMPATVVFSTSSCTLNPAKHKHAFFAKVCLVNVKLAVDQCACHTASQDIQGSLRQMFRMCLGIGSINIGLIRSALFIAASVVVSTSSSTPAAEYACLLMLRNSCL